MGSNPEFLSTCGGLCQRRTALGEEDKVERGLHAPRHQFGSFYQSMNESSMIQLSSGFSLQREASIDGRAFVCHLSRTFMSTCSQDWLLSSFAKGTAVLWTKSLGPFHKLWQEFNESQVCMGHWSKWKSPSPGYRSRGLRLSAPRCLPSRACFVLWK